MKPSSDICVHFVMSSVVLSHTSSHLNGGLPCSGIDAIVSLVDSGKPVIPGGKGETDSLLGGKSSKKLG